VGLCRKIFVTKEGTVVMHCIATGRQQTSRQSSSALIARPMMH